MRRALALILRSGLLLAIVSVCLSVAACPGAAQRPDGGKPAAHPADVTLFFTAELKGTLEPCGCTSDPLGDIARTAEQINAARTERPVALFDGGSTLYSEVPVPALSRAQEELTADLIAQLLPELGLAAAGLGPFDLGGGGPGVRFARQAANLPAGAAVPVEPPKLVDVGGLKIGVFGVVDPEVVPDLRAGDPAAAARAAVVTLRGQGAQLVVGLVALRRPAALKLAREVPGIDVLVVGQELPDRPPPAAEQVGGTVIVTPGNRGQVLARLDLHVDGTGGALVDAIGPERAAAAAAALAVRIARLEKDLAGWEKAPDAEQAFLAQNRADLAAMRRERQALVDRPLRAPAAGSWFVLRQVAIRKSLACDATVVAAKQKLDVAIGQANRAGAALDQPAPVPPGRAGFAGVEECGFCHKAAVTFWKGTRHAAAWATLTAAGKQGDRGCVSCHVTGWQEPGGATLAVNERLRDVQCEVCHGPAALHVDGDGKERPRSLAHAPAVDLCVTRCHTAEHSDTFQLEAYLRDVTGPGHGEALRRKLGDGPTGKALRAAAQARVGSELGGRCPK